jgi:hypothetical protein
MRIHILKVDEYDTVGSPDQPKIYRAEEWEVLYVFSRDDHSDTLADLGQSDAYEGVRAESSLRGEIVFRDWNILSHSQVAKRHDVYQRGDKGAISFEFTVYSKEGR